MNDHKPLQILFAKHKSVPHSCSDRVQLWALKLTQFDYEFVYARGADNVQSDCLSRLPLPDSVPESDPFELIFAHESICQGLLTHDLVKQLSERDPDIKQLQKFIKCGSSQQIDNPVVSKMKSNIPFMTILK